MRQSAGVDINKTPFMMSDMDLQPHFCRKHLVFIRDYSAKQEIIPIA